MMHGSLPLAEPKLPADISLIERQIGEAGFLPPTEEQLVISVDSTGPTAASVPGRALPTRGYCQRPLAESQ